jgi:hypothetical protein
MKVQGLVHEPDWEHIRDEAERVREDDQNTGMRDIERYEWKDGDNNHRVCPPFNARGRHFKKLGIHFNIKPDNETRDCLLSWPDIFDRCPICDAIDRILKLQPGLNLGRTETAWHYYANVIDRDDSDKGPQICRFTPGVRNWFMLQFDNRKVGDLADIERGFDVNTIKKEKKGKGKNKGRTFTEYKPDRDPDRSPLHESDDIVAKWLGEMFDLDKVMGPPDDDKVTEIRAMAKAMERYYLRKYRDDIENDDQRDGKREDVKSEANERRTSSRRDEDRDVKSPDDNDKHERRARADKVEDIDDVKPTDLPACHAGLDNPEKHNNGSIGFDYDLEKCMLCSDEMSCMNAKKQRGE